MDVLSVISGSLTLLQAAEKLMKLIGKVKGAQGKMKQYCDSLIIIHHLSHAVTDFAAGLDGDDKIFLNTCKVMLDVTTADATALLKRCTGEANPRFPRIVEWLKSRGKNWKFVLKEEDMQAYMGNISTVRSSMHLAITIAASKKEQSRHEDVSGSIAKMETRLTEQLRGLERAHHENVQKLESTHLHIQDSYARDSHVHKSGKLYSIFRGKRPQLLSSVSCSDTQAPESGVLHATLEATPDSISTDEQGFPIEIAAEELRSMGHIHTPTNSMRSVPETEACEREGSSQRDNQLMVPQASHHEQCGIQVTFDTGDRVWIPPGSEPRLIEGPGDEPTELPAEHAAQMSDLTMGSSYLKVLYPQAISDAVELVTFLRSDENDGEDADNPKSTPTEIINLESRPYFSVCSSQSLESDSDDSDSGSTDVYEPSLVDRKPDEGGLEYLCVERISIESDDRLYLTQPCEMPCYHGRIRLLDGILPCRKLAKYDYFTLVFIKFIDRPHGKFIGPRKGLDLPLYEECDSTCTHTRVLKSGSTSLGCVPPFDLLGWIRKATCTSNEIQVPCCFCRTQALDPEEVYQRSDAAMVQYGPHVYGYKCRRCDKVSWVTDAPESERRAPPE